MSALAAAILAQEPNEWKEQMLRQQAYDVHQDTESIVLLFCDETWPDGEIHKEAGWDRLLPIMQCRSSMALSILTTPLEEYCYAQWPRN